MHWRLPDGSWFLTPCQDQALCVGQLWLRTRAIGYSGLNRLSVIESRFPDMVAYGSDHQSVPHLLTWHFACKCASPNRASTSSSPTARFPKPITHPNSLFAAISVCHKAAKGLRFRLVVQPISCRSLGHRSLQSSNTKCQKDKVMSLASYVADTPWPHS